MATKTGDSILLGAGIVTVGAIPVGLTRGGSSFKVDRDVRQIEADGDKGPVKGRIVIDGETATLSIKALELFTQADMLKYYPATITTGQKVTSDLNIKEGDYNDVVWTGKRKDGKSIVITIKDALNMGNIEWGFEDKGEVVQEIEMTGTYDEATRDTPPWEIEYPVVV